MGGQILTRMLATTALVVVAFAPAGAQETLRPSDAGPNEGFYGNLSFSTGFEFDDNLSLVDPSRGNAYALTNKFNLEVGSVTSRSSLVFTLDGDLRYEDSPTRESEFFVASPSAGLRYVLSGPRSSLTLRGGYARSDLDRVLRVGTDIDGDEIPDIFDVFPQTGLLETTNTGIRFVSGRDTPIEWNIGYVFFDRDFSGDAGLDDTESDSISGGIRFTFSPVLTGDLRASRGTFAADDEFDTDRETTSLSFGLNYELDNVWTLGLTLGQTEIVTEETLLAVREITEETGTDVNLRATRALSFGQAFAEIGAETRVSGRRFNFEVGGAYDLPDGSISGSLGLTRSDFSGTDFTAALEYNKELQSSQLTASLSRAIRSSGDVDQEDQLVTGLSIVYLREVNETQSFLLGYNLSSLDNPNAADTVGTEYSATYNYGLAQDWNLNMGYRHRREERGQRTATSNSVFVTLSRDFSLF